MKKLIEFKSSVDFYHKERLGTKPNTVRFKDTDERFDLLKKFSNREMPELWIKIRNAQRPTKSFIRKVKDVSFFSSYGVELCVISWEVSHHGMC